MSNSPNGTAAGPARALGSRVFTTGQIAALCGVAPRTVNKWFDSGRVRGYRIPGGDDRRVPRAALLEFLQKNGLWDALQEVRGEWTVLCWGAPAALLVGLRSLLPAGNVLVRASHAAELGSLWERCRPDAVLLDGSEGYGAAVETTAWLLGQEAAPRAVVLLVPEDRAPGDLPEGAVGVRHPAEPADVARALRGEG